jgi:hypothetical protein
MLRKNDLGGVHRGSGIQIRCMEMEKTLLPLHLPSNLPSFTTTTYVQQDSDCQDNLKVFEKHH